MTDSSTFFIADLSFRWRAGPHLAAHDDWHRAYEAKIDRMIEQCERPGQPIELPAYPLRFDVNSDALLSEMGAYWEGAIYFIRNVLHARELFEGIEEARYINGNTQGYHHAKLFMAIWDSHGQLKWLWAFACRNAAIKAKIITSADAFDSSELYEKSDLSKGGIDLFDLGNFVQTHEEEGQKYPNPYFGGTNPLHLGLAEGLSQDFMGGPHQ